MENKENHDLKDFEVEEEVKSLIVSSHQKMIYFEQSINVESTSYNVPVLVKISDDTDFVKLRQAFYEIIQSKEILRTNFGISKGNIVQIIRAEVEFDFNYLEWNYFEQNDLLTLIKPFDLSKDLLIRVNIIRGDQGTFILLDAHHIIMDGLSVPLLFDEVIHCYADKKSTKNNTYQYKDYSNWQNQHLREGGYCVEQDFWIKALKDQIPVLEFKTDYPRNYRRNFNGEHIKEFLDSEWSKKLDLICRTNKVTTNTFLLSVLAFLLYKYTGQESHIIGSVSHGRNKKEIRKAIGMFNNFIPIKIDLKSSLTFKEFLLGNAERFEEYYKMGNYPYMEMIKDFDMERNGARNPLFDVMLIFHGRLENAFKGWDDFLVHYFELMYTKTSKLDFKFDISIEKDDSLKLILEYSTSLFKPETMERFLDYYLKTIKIFVRDFDIKLCDIELHSPKVISEMKFYFNGIKLDYPQESIYSLFKLQADLHPKNVALKYNNESLDYEDLYTRAEKIAELLVFSGVKKNDPLIIKMKQSCNVIGTILATLRIGAVFIPVLSSYPRERIDYIIRNSEAKFLITDKDSKDQIENIKNIYVDDYISFGGLLSEDKAEVLPEDIAYILYTSGTTGTPKGVKVRHKNVVNLICNSKELFDFNSNDIWSLFHSYAFDFSVWEIFGCLLHAATLVILPEITTKDPEQFLRLIYNEKITILNQTPTAFSNLISEEKKYSDRLLESVRYVIFGGENLRPQILRDTRNKYKDIHFINMYGITETTVHVTYKEITELEINSDISNIGRPIPNVNILLLDKDKKIVPIGGRGEIYVGGEGVSAGYMNNQDLTNSRFISDPYHAGKIIYSSGDVGHLLENYDIEYVGRNDSQVQLQGHRIELQEIEYVLLSHSNIDEVLVQKIEKEGEEYLCVYFIAEEELSVEEIRRFLGKKLPLYMIPTIYVRLKAFPLNHNSKVDKHRLPEPITNIKSSQQSNQDRRELKQEEEKLKGVWEYYLKAEGISAKDDFFKIGGNSMVALKMVALLNDHDIEIGVTDIYEHPSLEEMAEFINRHNPDFKNITGFADTQLLNKKSVRNKINIKDFSYEFDWLQLDCFHRPLSIIFESFGTNLGYSILLFASYANTHFIYEYEKVLGGNYFEVSNVLLEFYNNHLKERIGIDVREVGFQTPEEFYSRMISEIDQGRPILIPIDLYEIFYSKHYKDEHHIHYMIVKGYDEDKQLFYIQDNEHINGGDTTHYKSFIMRFCDLYNANQSYLKIYINNNKEGFFLSFGNKQIKEYGIKHAFMDFSEIIKDAEDKHLNIIYLESQVIRMHQRGILPDINRSIIYLLNFKIVYCKIMIRFVADILQGKELAVEFNSLIHNILDSWTSIRKVFYGHYAENNTEYNEEDNRLAEKCISLEKKLVEKLRDLMNVQRYDLPTVKTNLPANLWKEHNNHKRVMEMQGEEIIIEHGINEVDLTWHLDDNAPQVLMNFSGRNFSLQAGVQSKTEKGYRFFLGIIIKLASGKNILYGNYRNRKLAIFIPEYQLNDALAEIDINPDILFLQIQGSEGAFTFLYKNTENEQYQILKKCTLNDTVTDIGFFSNKHDRFVHHAIISKINYEIDKKLHEGKKDGYGE